MRITTDFPGGNAILEKIEGSTVYIERDLRTTIDDWFYWAFGVKDAAGQTVTFRFPNQNRVGRFGPAVSRDGIHWKWAGTEIAGNAFTYTFGADENRVFFAHDMLYQPTRFERFCTDHGLTSEEFCVSEKGRSVPCVRYGDGEKYILLTARHHACESTGSYVLEGVLATLIDNLPAGYAILCVPCVDYDGVVDGDQGKNRAPYDHNRDYPLDGAPSIYASIRAIRAFADTHTVAYAFDFHSPWHMWEQNDVPFISRSTESMEARNDRFSAYLEKESAGHTLAYERKNDVGPNEQWNHEDSPNCKNYFARRADSALVVTLETPYFGLPGHVISEDAMCAFGVDFAHAVLDYIDGETK